MLEWLAKKAAKKLGMTDAINELKTQLEPFFKNRKSSSPHTALLAQNLHDYFDALLTFSSDKIIKYISEKIQEQDKAAPLEVTDRDNYIANLFAFAITSDDSLKLAQLILGFVPIYEGFQEKVRAFNHTYANDMQQLLDAIAPLEEKVKRYKVDKQAALSTASSSQGPVGSSVAVNESKNDQRVPEKVLSISEESTPEQILRYIGPLEEQYQAEETCNHDSFKKIEDQINTTNIIISQLKTEQLGLSTKRDSWRGKLLTLEEKGQIGGKIGSLTQDINSLNSKMSELSQARCDLHRKIEESPTLVNLKQAYSLLAKKYSASLDALESDIQLAGAEAVQLNAAITNISNTKLAAFEEEIKHTKQRLQRHKENIKNLNNHLLALKLEVTNMSNAIVAKTLPEVKALAQTDKFISLENQLEGLANVTSLEVAFKEKEQQLNVKINGLQQVIDSYLKNFKNYLTKRAITYQVRDFFSGIVAFFFGWLGYKTEKQRRTDFICKDLEPKLIAYKTETTNEKANELSAELKNGISFFKPRAKKGCSDYEESLQYLMIEANKELERLDTKLKI